MAEEGETLWQLVSCLNYVWLLDVVWPQVNILVAKEACYVQYLLHFALRGVQVRAKVAPM